MELDLEEGHGKYEIETNNRSVRIVFEDNGQTAKSSADPRNQIASSAPILPAREKQKGAEPEASANPGGSTGNEKKTALERRPAPVINDLSTSEIPLSALGTGAAAEVKARQTPTPLREAPSSVPTPVVPKPPVPASPVLTIDASQAQPSQFTGQPLTLDLVDIPLVDFFRLMAEEGGINIVIDPQVTGTISIKVVKVPWDQIFDAALQNNGLDKKVEGNLVRIARKSTLQSEAKQQEDLKKANLLAADIQTRIKRLNYAKAAAMLPTLEEQKSVRGVVKVDERSNALVITDIPDSIVRILELIEALDIPQPQVEIEARIISATRDFARDIGIQFGFVQGNLERVSVGGPNTFGTIGGTRPTATPTSTFAGGNPATGRGAATSQASGSAGVSTGAGSGPPTGNLNVNLPAGRAFGGLGISIGNIFDTFLLDAAITAGEAKGLAKLISQPKVTTQNNQEAIVTQGLRFPVQIVANQTVTIQFQNAALTLTVTPQITQEGNVILQLKVENNTPDFSRSVNGVPSIRTSESTTRVLVSDGGTTVIGGILTDTESNNEDRVPGLASLPIVGNIFKRTSIVRTVQEVIFFITPRIVK
jgi:type IV pilus assembly protein PilQ